MASSPPPPPPKKTETTHNERDLPNPIPPQNKKQNRGLKERRKKEARRRARRKRRAARAAAEAAAAAAEANNAGGDEENAAPAGDNGDDGDEATAAKDAERRRKAQREAGTSEAEGAQEEGDASDDASDEDGDGGDPFARDPAGAAAVLCHHAIIARNKRLLLTYLSERVERLKALRWRHAVLPPRVRQGLSSSEAEFFGAYDRLLSRYSSSGSGSSPLGNGAAGLDLTQADRPPRPPGGVMVRCVSGAGLGDVAFSTGTFRLDPGSVHTLPPEEAEPLLREGVLVEVTNGAREQQEMPAL